ncbi:MAG: glutathione-regulated potassium-efflux system protein KefB [Archangium gephyra]|uniref:Glutathione-regulated potassium-efflux system protein KefB n=1 Tax=Archangium gephyra TaxID=48 RepID=A0A2W5V7L9_9BACT|nr:MAG: glutathione-regulated potassium-efflux system protein KefB [Archangium gephyra]
MSFIHDAVIFLVAAVIGVALFKRFGLGAVLGYLVAGVVVGPSGFKLVSNVESVMSTSELGVVLLLFVIGLELQPQRLWTMRGNVFGVGSVQVGVTTLLFTLVGALLGLPWLTAFVLGFSFSLSSTALAVQALAERNQLTAQHGRIAFGILLFQDVAAIPFLAMVPMLAGTGGGFSLLGVLKVLGTFAAMVVASRFVLRPALKAIASLHVPELFTASALLVVVGTALVMELIGLSATLGAFLAGVLLADSEYRHELEADIAPFKGLLLGLFFMSVGMSVNLSLAAQKPFIVLGLVLGLVAVKAAVLFGIGWWRTKDRVSAIRLAISTSQGGEFAFVVVKLATTTHLMWTELEQLVVFIVGASLATTPVFFALFERFVAPRLAPKKERDFDKLDFSEETPVIVAGFGRVGQVVGRVLSARKIPFVALDASPDHVDFIRRFGNKVFYGDASRLELLEAAGAAKARVFVLAIDDVKASVATAHAVQKHFPHLRIVARARNRQHAYELKAMGIHDLFRETFAGSVEMTRGVLVQLGMPWSEAHRTMEIFRDLDERLLEDSFHLRGDMQSLQQKATSARAELEKLFEADSAALSPGKKSA